MKYNFIWHRQPFKAIYFLYAAIFLLVSLPLWTLLALFPAFRPRRSWTFSRTLLFKAAQAMVPVLCNTLSFNLTRLDPRHHSGKEEEVALVWIDAAPELVIGEVREYARKNNVAAAPVAAYWVGEREPFTNKVGYRARPNEKVILNVHAGAWLILHAGPGSFSHNMCQDMLARFPQFTRALNVEYRLSQGPPLPQENPFPAALIDMITAYNYLVNGLGFKPHNILVTGDSCGGSLAFQLARYIIRAQPPTLALPRAFFLLSPSPDWGGSHMLPHSSMAYNQSTDYIDGFTSGYATRALLGNLPFSHAFEDPWISPASHEILKKDGIFAGYPPTLMLTGDVELFSDAVKTTRDRMVADGVDVELVVVPDGTHCMIALPFHDREKEDTYSMVVPWVKEHFS